MTTPTHLKVSREAKSANTVVNIGPLQFGTQDFPVIAGPCAVESLDQTLQAARDVQLGGASALRGGAFKPRTSPYSFQGLGAEGLTILGEARRQTGLPIVTEIMDVSKLDLIMETADILQIGARNMQNFALLEAVGRQRLPVLLKRGMCATLSEFLHAAEYIVANGNPNVILCERGIRTFGNDTRNTLDIAAVPLLKSRTHLPVIVDPSHACGLSELVTPLAQAALAVGADGLIVEVHPTPHTALSDGRQSLDARAFAEMMRRLAIMAPTVGRRVQRPGKMREVA